MLALLPDQEVQAEAKEEIAGNKVMVLKKKKKISTLFKNLICIFLSVCLHVRERL